MRPAITMSFIKAKFSHEHNAEFFTTLKKRVNQYFQSSNLSTTGDKKMIFKTIFMFAFYLTPYILLLTGLFQAPWMILALWIFMGFGMAGIGLSVMHDANHGAFSGNKKVNEILGYSMNFIGSNAFIWKIQHNVLHHSFTNIEGQDEDIHMPLVLRFSPHQKRYWFHRFQHIYAWFLYGLMTMLRLFVSDFTRAWKYRSMKLVTEKVFRKELFRAIAWKLFYFGYILVLPIVLMPEHAGIFILSFFVMQFISGFILAIIFQTAHVMPNCEYPLPDENGRIENSWAVHEMLTTTNYSPGSRIFSWLIGGLNYQVEHHLFSHISHVHYKDLSRIVRETAEEFNVPYNSEKNFLIAIWNHAIMLRNLGRHDALVPVNA